MPGRKKVKIEAKDYKMTAKFSSALLKLEACLEVRYGICINGPSNSGKSTLLKILSQKYCKDLLTVYLDSSIDSKNIIGTYICGEVPGEFI